MNAQIKNALLRLYQEGKSLDDELSLPELRRRGAVDGIPALDLPTIQGGVGMSCVEMASIFAFCGELDLDLRDLPGLGHARILLCSQTLSPNQQSILSGVAHGRDFIGVAITEEHTEEIGGSDLHTVGGSDLRGMRTIVKPVHGGYLLRGAKTYVARLSQASFIVTFAKLENIPDELSLVAFVIPLADEKFPIEQFHSMGLKGASFGSIQFNDIFVPEDMRIKTAEDGIKLFNKHFEYWRTAMAAAAVGCARGAIKQALQWLTHREAFGGPIGRFTHLQQELSKHTAKLRMAWLLIVSTMQKIDNNEDAFVQAAMTKAEAVEIALEAADWSMKIHAARGYTNKLDLEKRVRDLLGLRVADGATDLLRGQVARSLLGDEMYEKALNRPYPSETEHPLLINDLLG